MLRTTLRSLAARKRRLALTAIAIVWGLRYSFRTAMTVAVGLAQIGEFSFILADVAAHNGLLTARAQSLLVACAIVSITPPGLVHMGVQVGPGSTAFTRICGASSIANALVRFNSAALNAP